MDTGTDESVLEEPQEEATVEAETPTKTEAETRLEAELAEMREQLNKRDESYKGLQRTLNIKDAEIKRRSDDGARLDALSDQMKILAAMQAERMQVDTDVDNLPTQAKTNYLEQFENVKKEHEKKQQLQQLKERIAVYQERADSLSLAKDDIEYIDIKDAAVSGNFERAEALLKKLEKQRETSKETTVKGEDKVEDFDAKVKAEVDKRITEAAKDNPLLKTDTAIPSGRAKTAEDTLTRFSEGDRSVSFDDYEQARKQLGIT